MGVHNFTSNSLVTMQIAQQIYVAEEWVKKKDVQVQAEARSREDVETALGKAKDESARLSEQLKEEAKARRNVEAGLKTAEKQAEDQRQKLYTAEINLETQKALVTELRAELEKAKDAAKLAKEDAQLAKEAVEAEKQAAYTLGVQETQARLTEEFAKVCRGYCDITWSKCLDAAGVPAESALRQPGSIYYDPDISDVPETLEAPSANQNPPAPAETSHAPLQTGDAGDLPKPNPAPQDKASDVQPV